MLLEVVVSLALVAASQAAETVATYDYVIVGGGTAGTALATRLSQGLPSASILLLEAGPSAPDELRIDVPGMRGAGLFSAYDWNFTTVAQRELFGRRIDVNRGRVLGGSSALNYLCYDRAAAAEYDAWGALGNPGWGWSTMLPAMLKSENFSGPDDGDKHGYAGPIHSTYTRLVPEFLRTWQPTMSSLGVNVNDGSSLGGAPVGVMFQPTNIDVAHYNRSYSAVAYLPLAGSNLVVWTNSRVAKVEFAPSAPGPAAAGAKLTATGVVLQDGTKIAARREVILSAGSIGSPGLLELSGIGQASVLKAAGITQLIDLPGVGENYQDHIRTAGTYRLKAGLNLQTFDPLIYDPTGSFATAQLGLWLQNKLSWLDYTSLAYAFLNWKQVVGAAAQSDLAATAASTDSSTARTGSSVGSVIDKAKAAMLLDATVPQVELLFEANYVGAAGYPSSGGGFLTLIMSVMHPMSRGSVHVDPSGPLTKDPVIDPRYLSHPYDVAAVVAGSRFFRTVAQTAPMSDLWDVEFDPGVASVANSTNPTAAQLKQWETWARNTTNTFYHPVATCAMMPLKDGGVVDPTLKVYGTANLRVVDASIIPILPSAHIQTAVYGIAEIAATMAIADAKKS